MMFFAAGRPSPYHPTPCVALSRHETPIYQSTHLKDIEARDALLKELAKFKASRKCNRVIGFGGEILEDEGDEPAQSTTSFDPEDMAPLAPIETNYD